MNAAAELLELLATSEHLPDPLPDSPLPLLHAWLQEAIAAANRPNPDAMVLSTTGEDGSPNSRVVLCKRFHLEAGTLTFYTTAGSRKAREIAADPRAAALFHWDHLGRQARLRGQVRRAPDAEVDNYFATRPLLSRIAAWASDQSQPLDSPITLFERVLAALERFNLTLDDLATDAGNITIPRPPTWVGFHFHIDSVELWTGRAGRLHDRAVWTRAESRWCSTRLHP